MERQIGWYILKEDKEFVDRGYACAAWWERLLVPAGKYPIMVDEYKECETEDGLEVYGRISSASVAMKGTVVADDFGARYCGVPVGPYDNYQNAGKESWYHFTIYLHGLALLLLEGEESCYRGCIANGEVFELLPEYEAKEIRFDWEGEEHTTHGIFRKEV